MGRAGRLTSGTAKLVRRLPAMLDNFVSSMSNTLTFLIVANAFDTTNAAGANSVGAFSLCMAVYIMTVAAVRAVVGEPLLSLYSDVPEEDLRGLSGEMQGATLFIGVIGSLIVGASSVVVGGITGSALMALALVLPLVLFQDTWRYIFIIHQPVRAVVIDLVWLVTIMVGLLVLIEGVAVFWFIFVWGITGGIGGLVGMVLNGGLRGAPHPWAWLVRHREMATRFFGESFVAHGASEISMMGLAAVGGVAAAGVVKAGRVFYGFLNTLGGGLMLAVTPEGVRQRGQRRKLRRILAVTTVATSALSVAWMAVGLLVPDGWGRLAFGTTWDKGQVVLLPMGIAMLARAVRHRGFIGLRSLGDARSSFRARMLSAPWEFVFPVVGAAMAGVQGFAIGYAVSQWLAAGVWSLFFDRAASAPRHLRRREMSRDALQLTLGGWWTPRHLPRADGNGVHPRLEPGRLPGTGVRVDDGLQSRRDVQRRR